MTIFLIVFLLIATFQVNDKLQKGQIIVTGHIYVLPQYIFLISDGFLIFSFENQ